MISRGISTVAHGMQALIDFEDVTAHNLANVNTTGFKRSNITFQDIMQTNIISKNELGKYKNVGTLSNGARSDRTYIDFSQGGLQETGHKLDVAIQGEGFYKVRHREFENDNAPYDERQYYYQRTGNFQLDDDNYLVNRDGDYIMDMQNRKIRITRDFNALDLDEINRMDLTKDLVINQTGQIQICDFEDKTKISNIGEGKYLPIYGQDAGLYTKQDGTYSLEQGMMEMSNASTIVEMLNSINVSRGYESMSTILKRQSETISQAINLGNIKQ